MIDEKALAAKLLPLLISEAKFVNFTHDAPDDGQWHLYRGTSHTHVDDVKMALTYFIRRERYEEPVGHYRLMSKNFSFTFHVSGTVKRSRWDKDQIVPINNTDTGSAIITKTELVILTSQEEAEDDLVIVRMAI